MSNEQLFQIDRINHRFNRENPIDLNRINPISYKSRRLLQRYIETTEDSDFRRRIDNGNITLAAIKPQAQNSRLGIDNDLEASKILLDIINLDPILTPIFSISFKLSRDVAESFYPPELKSILNRPENENSGNGWGNFMDFLTSGPITYLVLWDTTESGLAIPRWREIIGATDPKEASPGTIRGNYAISKQANLVHGSASVEDVRKEIDWLGNLIKKIIIK